MLDFAACGLLRFSSGGVLLDFAACGLLRFSSGNVLLGFSACGLLRFSSGGVLLGLAACGLLRFSFGGLLGSSAGRIVGFLLVLRGVADPVSCYAMVQRVRHGSEGPRQWKQQETEGGSKRVLAHGNTPFHLLGTVHADAVFQKKRIYTLVHASGID